MGTQRLVVVLMACIAALTVVPSCSQGGGDTEAQGTPVSSPSPRATPAPAPTSIPTTPGPSGYDELNRWSTGQTAPSMIAYAELLGLTTIYMTGEPLLDKGFVGVAPFETACIVAFSSTNASPPETLSAIVLLRYTSSLNELTPNMTVAQLKTFLDARRQLCRGGPMPTAPSASPV